MKENTSLFLQHAERDLISARRMLQRALMNDESEQDYEIAQTVQSCLDVERRITRLMAKPEVPAIPATNNVTPIRR